MAVEIKPGAVERQVSPLIVGLSQDDIALLEGVVVEGQIKDLDVKAARRIRGAAAFLIRAQSGMQWQDFNNQTDPLIRSNRDFYLDQRSLMLATLYPMVYPGKATVPNKLPRDEAIKVQRMIAGFKEAMNKFCESLSLNQSERENMQDAVQFFKNFGIQEIHSTRKQ